MDNKKHRADVFIDNTVIEFQHSRISYEEFQERNDFYNSLGYKVIWIFDATEAYQNKNIVELFDGNYSWNNCLIQLKGYNRKMVDVYLQEFKNIWNSTPDYKNISLGNDELEDYAYLHHIDETASISLDTFLSKEKNNLFDYEFVDKFVQVKFLHDGSFDPKLDMKKRDFSLSDLSDEILTPEEYAFGRNRFIWCPAVNHFVNSYDECHACTHLSDNNNRCKFRFEKLLSKQFDKIINIEYPYEGKVKSVVILKDKKRYKIKYNETPKGIFTIKEAFEDKKDTQIIRIRNINTGWEVQINRYNYNMMIRNNRCYGKIQGPDSWSNNFSKNENEIYNFNRKEWEIIWRK